MHARSRRLGTSAVGHAPREAPKSVGSNGETVFRVKGERAFEVDVWTFNRRCRLLWTNTDFGASTHLGYRQHSCRNAR